LTGHVLRGPRSGFQGLLDLLECSTDPGKRGSESSSPAQSPGVELHLGVDGVALNLLLQRLELGQRTLGVEPDVYLKVVIDLLELCPKLLRELRGAPVPRTTSLVVWFT